MTKPIPKICSRRNGHIDSCRSEHRIIKRVIHVQVSFNDTIVIFTCVWGRMVSWSLVSTSGFSLKNQTRTLVSWYQDFT